MDNNETWEQPENSDNVPVADAKIDDSTPSSDDGSQYGKFKDAESLLTAYNNLQAEFTRKCQRLSEMEKQEQQKQETLYEQTPIFENEDWQEKVSKFLDSHKDAKQYASLISQYIIQNPDLKNEKNALDIAWAKVISEKYKSPENIISDDKFIDEYVLTNEHIKQKILSTYIKDLERKKIPPFVTSTSGGNVAFQTQQKATTLDEAKSLVEKILKTN